MQESKKNPLSSLNIENELSSRQELSLARFSGVTDDFRNSQDEQKIITGTSIHRQLYSRRKCIKLAVCLLFLITIMLAGIFGVNGVNLLSQKPIASSEDPTPQGIDQKSNHSKSSSIEEIKQQASQPQNNDISNNPDSSTNLNSPNQSGPNQFNQHHRNTEQQNDEQKKIFKQELQFFNLMIPDQPKVDRTLADMYFFNVSIQQMIWSSDVFLMYVDNIKVDNISWQQKTYAILRTQLVHSISFTGEVEVQLSHFDKSVLDKEKAVRQILKQEQQYYEETYKLNKYNNHQLRFCLVVTAFNSFHSRLYLRNLDSIFMQDYHNYHVVYIDNASPDKTGENVNRYLQFKRIPSDKIEVLIKPENVKPMQIIYNVIHSHCPNGQVVGLMNGNDSLVGRKVLQLYNAVYHQKKAALVYSNFLMIMTNNKTEVGFGFGRTIDEPELDMGSVRKSKILPGHHLMTFFSDLFKKIWRQDLCYRAGVFFYEGQDKAILTPMLEMAYPRVEYIPEITYEHRNDKGMNNMSEQWENVANIIKGRKSYMRLNDFGFVDRAIDAGQSDRSN